MNRQDMLHLISQAQDVPPAIRAAGLMFLSRMTDAQLEDLGGKAGQVQESLKVGDLAATEKLLASFGLPGQYVKIILALVSRYAKRDDCQQ